MSVIVSPAQSLTLTQTQAVGLDAVVWQTKWQVGPWGTLSWTYDGVGNRQKETSNSNETNYTYTANKLISTTGEKAFTFTYDNNGNTISEDGKRYIYNQNQRLIKVTENGTTKGEYIYNGNGQRVKKTTSLGVEGEKGVKSLLLTA